MADRIIVEDSIDGRRQRCVVCGRTEAMPIDPNTNASNVLPPKLIVSSGGATSVESGVAVKSDEIRESISSPPITR